MRLLASSPHLGTLLGIPFLAAMLALAANAEPASKPNAAQTQATAGTAAQPNSGTTSAQTKPATTAPSVSAGGEATVGNSSAASGEAKPAGSGEPKPEGSATAAAAPEKPKSSILVNIDKSTQEMTVFVDGVELYTWPVSTGRRGYSTPSGTYTTSSMNKIWYSKQWDNAPMYHAIFFTKKGHAIHGTLEEKNLGKAASHGCVRISRANAETLYALVEQNGLDNTQVVLTGTTPGGEGPAVASQGPSRQPGAFPPWFAPGEGYYQQQPPRRRGFFRFFQPYPGPQGYYVPRGNNYYRGPRGW